MTGAGLYGICHTRCGEVFIVTSMGQLRRALPGGWTVAADLSPLGGALHAVCAVGKTVRCCGEAGIFRHCQGRTEALG